MSHLPHHRGFRLVSLYGGLHLLSPRHGRCTSPVPRPGTFACHLTPSRWLPSPVPSTRKVYVTRPFVTEVYFHSLVVSVGSRSPYPRDGGLCCHTQHSEGCMSRFSLTTEKFMYSDGSSGSSHFYCPLVTEVSLRHQHLVTESDVSRPSVTETSSSVPNTDVYFYYHFFSRRLVTGGLCVRLVTEGVGVFLPFSRRVTSFVTLQRKVYVSYNLGTEVDLMSLVIVGLRLMSSCHGGLRLCRLVTEGLYSLPRIR